MNAEAELRIHFDPAPDPATVERVQSGVNLHNVAVTGLSDYHASNFLLRSPRGELLGGLFGAIWGGWLHITFLWVSESVRGQDWGSRLMAEAEAHAIEKGCVGATLETFSFQARPFYERLGYEVFGMIEDYPPAHAKYFLKKRLSAPVP